jgi:putative transposase
MKYPLSLRNVEDLLAERGIAICHETVRFWWNRFGPLFAAEIRRKRGDRMGAFTHWRWHLDEVFVKINGQTHYLWRAVDHEGEVLESYVTKTPGQGRSIEIHRAGLIIGTSLKYGLVKARGLRLVVIGAANTRCGKCAWHQVPMT